MCRLSVFWCFTRETQVSQGTPDHPHEAMLRNTAPAFAIQVTSGNFCWWASGVREEPELHLKIYLALFALENLDFYVQPVSGSHLFRDVSPEEYKKL